MRANMRAERARLGISLREAASLVGVHENALTRWEKGEAEPMGENLLKLSHLYQCPPDYLMGYTDDRNGVAVAKSL